MTSGLHLSFLCLFIDFGGIPKEGDMQKMWQGTWLCTASFLGKMVTGKQRRSDFQLKAKRLYVLWRTGQASGFNSDSVTMKLWGEL